MTCDPSLGYGEQHADTDGYALARDPVPGAADPAPATAAPLPITALKPVARVGGLFCPF